MMVGGRRFVGLASIPNLKVRTRRWAESSGRLRLVLLLRQTAPGWAVALWTYVVALSVLPILVLAAMGQVVGRIPAAARSGLGSPAGHALLVALVVSVAAYAANLVLGPVETMLSSVIKVRLTYAMQERLVTAVSAPSETTHLEDSEVLNELELANGKLTSYYPADAAMSLAVVTGTRLSGLFACAVLGTYRWWLGLEMLALWLFVRRPLRRVVAEQAQAFGRTAGLMRRARYLQQLAVKPPVAKESRVFGFGEWLRNEFRHQWTIGMEASWRMIRRYNIGVTKLSSLVLAGYALAISVLAFGAYRHEITLTALSTLLPMLAASAAVGDISWTDVALEWQLIALPNLERLEARLQDTVSVSRSDGGGVKHPRPSGSTFDLAPREKISFEHVAFQYPGSNAPVFTDLCLELVSGQSTAIVGYNGAGKTTLVKLLARLHEPSGGLIRVDDWELNEADASAWQRKVAVVFQDFVHYPFSLAENIGVGAVEQLGHAGAQNDAVAEAARRAGLSDVVQSLPLQWETKLSAQYAGGVDLSGGQWQRVALARALMAASHGARILVLDEPTAWLDARGEAEFFANFIEITAGLTTLVISHRFSTVRRADRICVIDDGAVVETGTHDELIKLGGRYAEMFAAQSERFASPLGKTET
jgi:ATP-binding cassette subfamily B protein